MYIWFIRNEDMLEAAELLNSYDIWYQEVNSLCIMVSVIDFSYVTDILDENKIFYET